MVLVSADTQPYSLSSWKTNRIVQTRHKAKIHGLIVSGLVVVLIWKTLLHGAYSKLYGDDIQTIMRVCEMSNYSPVFLLISSCRVLLY